MAHRPDGFLRALVFTACYQKTTPPTTPSQERAPWALVIGGEPFSIIVTSSDECNVSGDRMQTPLWQRLQRRSVCAILSF